MTLPPPPSSPCGGLFMTAPTAALYVPPSPLAPSVEEQLLPLQALAARHAERTKGGVEGARRRGTRIGNQAVVFDKERAPQLRDRGWGQIRIARELGVGVGRVHRWVQEEYRPLEARRVREGVEAALPS